MARSRGATVEDVDGNVYIDCWGGAGVVNVGHNNPEIVAAARAQMDDTIHAIDLPSALRDRFVTTLFDLLPASLRDDAKIHFAGPTGADAVEAAVKLVKTATSRRGIFSFQGGYHGSTAGALSLTGLRSPKEAVQSLMPDVHFMPYAYCYRCPMGLEPDTCKMACAALTETALADPLSGVLTPAGIIVEAVQGEGGTIPAPPEFLQAIARSARKHGVPLIADEIQCGIGRTGRMFGFEHAGLEPDVIVLSKAIGGVGMPIAVVIYRRDLDQWKPGAHIGTFRGFLPAMAAGVAALSFMQRHDLVEYAREVGGEFKTALEGVASAAAIVGDVRGVGLMLGLEIVQEPGSKTPAPRKAAAVRSECLKRGLLIELGGRFDSVVRLLPPLVITRTQIRRAVEIIGAAISAVEASD